MQENGYAYITVVEEKPGHYVLEVFPPNIDDTSDDMDEEVCVESATFNNAEEAYDWIENNNTTFPVDDNWRMVSLERLVSGASSKRRFKFRMELVPPDEGELDIDNPLNRPRLVALIEDEETPKQFRIWTYGLGYGIRELPVGAGKEAWSRLFSNELSFDHLYEIFEL